MLNIDYIMTGQTEESARCPCCNYKTLSARGEHEICPVCFWHDDGFEELDEISSPNHITLREGRKNFHECGACEPRLIPHVRPPEPSEY